MAKLVTLFISSRWQMAIGLLLAVAFFGLIVAGALLFAMQEARRVMANESQPVLRPFADRAENAAETFASLKSDVTAPPCTPEFAIQLRRIGYRPDGFNDFFYAPQGIVECSVSMGRFDPPVALGPPDMPARDGEPAMWVDRGLAFAGLNGLVGTVLQMDPFALVLPLERMRMDAPAWMTMEIVSVAPSGRWWHRGGEQGLYGRYKTALRRQDGAIDTALRSSMCLPSGRVCVVTEAPLMALLGDFKVYAIATVVAALALAAWLARMAQAMIVRRWSFDSRFRRHLDSGSILCAYQPIMDLQSGRITGCEVLARWRDVDGSVVYPDRFIPLVEQWGLTRKFTRMLVEKASVELASAVSNDRTLTVTFNVFPCDFDSSFLCGVFKAFDRAAGRFDIVVEIVESEAIEVVAAQQQIEVLRAAGIRSYIDDFGTGYSNIHHLAALAVDGVKLDRSFAMAAEGSVMARMLGFAVDMIRASGRPVIVEGVETADRLRQLRSMTPPIDYVQGYHISRPLDAETFAAFVQRSSNGIQHLELVA